MHFAGCDRIRRCGIALRETVETSGTAFGSHLHFIATPSLARYQKMEQTVGTGGTHNVLHGSPDLCASNAEKFGGTHFVHVDEAIFRSDDGIIILVEVGAHDTTVETDIDFAFHGEELVLFFSSVGNDVTGAVDTTGQETGRV